MLRLRESRASISSRAARKGRRAHPNPESKCRTPPCLDGSYTGRCLHGIHTFREQSILEEGLRNGRGHRLPGPLRSPSSILSSRGVFVANSRGVFASSSERFRLQNARFVLGPISGSFFPQERWGRYRSVKTSGPCRLEPPFSQSQLVSRFPSNPLIIRVPFFFNIRF